MPHILQLLSRKRFSDACTERQRGWTFRSKAREVRMFGVKERQAVDQSANYFDERHEISTFRNIVSILIVDEDRDILNQLSQSFAICAKQYNIYLAQNGKDALEVLKTSKVNIW